MSASMTLSRPPATATLQDRLAELVALGRSLQLNPPPSPPLSLPAWPSVAQGETSGSKAFRRVVVAGAAVLLMTHGYQLATAIVGAPERPSFVGSGAGTEQHPRPVGMD